MDGDLKVVSFLVMKSKKMIKLLDTIARDGERFRMQEHAEGRVWINSIPWLECMRSCGMIRKRQADVEGSHPVAPYPPKILQI